MLTLAIVYALLHVLVDEMDECFSLNQDFLTVKIQSICPDL